MAKGVWGKWQMLSGTVLALVCLSCQPALGPARSTPLPPPQPKATPGPQQRPIYYVKVDLLNLRAGPGMDFPKIGSLNRNDELEKVGEVDDWVQVRMKRDGTVGWVAARFLSETPVSAPPPVATPEHPSTAPSKEAAPAEPKPPKPTKVDTVLPRAPKPAEAAEPPAPKPKPVAEPIPVKEPVSSPEAKPEPKPVEPPTPPAPEPPGEKPQRIRIM